MQLLSKFIFISILLRTTIVLATPVEIQWQNETYSFEIQSSQSAIDAPIIVKETLAFVQEADAYFDRVFKIKSTIPLRVNLIENRNSLRNLGVSKLTAALFDKGVIIIPLANGKFKTSSRKLRTAIFHEYAHHLIVQISNGNAPVWLDEGLAQYMDGSNKKSIQRELKIWVQNNPPTKLSLLPISFVSLDEEFAGYAYGVSYFAVRKLVFSYGIQKVLNIMENLKSNSDFNLEFKNEFKISFNEFESEIVIELSLNRKY